MRLSKLFRGTIRLSARLSRNLSEQKKEDVLLMGDDVVNQTIPLILCAEEDVKGSHAHRVEQLDEETLFYMQARGISEEQAVCTDGGCENRSGMPEDSG